MTVSIIAQTQGPESRRIRLIPQNCGRATTASSYLRDAPPVIVRQGVVSSSRPRDAYNQDVGGRDALLLATLAMDLGLLVVHFRMLTLHPVPVLGRRSMRRYALNQLAVPLRQRMQYEHRRTLGRVFRVLLFGGLLALVFLPRWRFDHGPFANAKAAKDYLQTSWQVLAAAIGVSVALIAFVFEAFLTSGERRHGGTLREFARQTRIMWLFDLAALSLTVDGLALAEVRGVAPAGWPGLMAAALSGLTLLMLLVAVPRVILRSLDPSELRALRLDATRELARRAVREQLLGHIVASTIHRQRESGVAQGVSGMSRGVAVTSGRGGVVHDIRLGVLQRALHGLHLNEERSADVVAELERGIHRASPLVMLPEAISGRRRWRVRRAFRIRRGASELGATALSEALARLRQQALAAIAREDEVEWRDLEELLYELLLELPRASQQAGVTFDDQISRPGWFRRGPAEEIFEILDAAMERALQVESLQLARQVIYIVYRAGRDAQHLDAPGLVSEAARFFPGAYFRTRQRLLTARSHTAARLPVEIVDQLFELADAVGVHQMAFGDSEVPLNQSQEHLRRVLAAVRDLTRSVIEERDSATFDELLTKLDGVPEFWDYWSQDRRGEVQRELIADLAVLRMALASWALHLLGRSSDQHEWPVWQQMSFRLLDPLTTVEMATAYWQLAQRERVLGDDYSFWFYNEQAGGVQTLDSNSKAALALVVALALRAEGGEQVRFEADEEESWRVQDLLGALELVRRDPDRYGPAFGRAVGGTGPGDEEPPTVSRREPRPRPDPPPRGDQGAEPPADAFAGALDTVQRALEEAGADMAERQAARTREAELDPNQVSQFRSLVAKTVAEERLLKPLLQARGSWHLLREPSWPDRKASAWSSKRAYIGDRSFVGQDMNARQMGRRAALSEMHDLIQLFADLPSRAVGADVAAELHRELAAMRDAGLEPTLIVLPINFRVLQALQVRMKATADDLTETAVSAVHAPKFNGAFDRVPVIDNPNLKNRILVLDLAAIRMEERPTPGEVGVEPRVRAFGADEAAEFAAEYPQVVEALPPQERVPWLQEHVLLEVLVGWRMFLENREAAHVFDLPDELRRDG
jgi:hypothetical protein